VSCEEGSEEGSEGVARASGESEWRAAGERGWRERLEREAGEREAGEREAGERLERGTRGRVQKSSRKVAEKWLELLFHFHGSGMDNRVRYEVELFWTRTRVATALRG
jgi:hypothetical protein